jgi:hypothetical protein
MRTDLMINPVEDEPLGKFAVGRTADGLVIVTVFGKHGETVTKMTLQQARQLAIQILQAAQ